MWLGVLLCARPDTQTVMVINCVNSGERKCVLLEVLKSVWSQMNICSFTLRENWVVHFQLNQQVEWSESKSFLLSTLNHKWCPRRSTALWLRSQLSAFTSQHPWPPGQVEQWGYKPTTFEPWADVKSHLFAQRHVFPSRRFVSNGTGGT